jgi:hypothetical protein
MAGIVVSYAETIAIQGFLGYLNKNYSKAISVTDTYLIAAVAAWFHQESGGLKSVIGNNPFNIRSSPLESGYRQTTSNGQFAIFSTMAQGFAAAAYLLIHGSTAYGYQLALNALKNGGNQAAVDFLAALAMSSWDIAHYGATDWLSAYDVNKNHLLSVYLGVKGIQLINPVKPRPKPPPKPPPKLPVDHAYHETPREYTDPWAAGILYAGRHRATVATSRRSR